MDIGLVSSVVKIICRSPGFDSWNRYKFSDFLLHLVFMATLNLQMIVLSVTKESELCVLEGEDNSRKEECSDLGYMDSRY